MLELLLLILVIAALVALRKQQLKIADLGQRLTVTRRLVDELGDEIDTLKPQHLRGRPSNGATRVDPASGSVEAPPVSNATPAAPQPSRAASPGTPAPGSLAAAGSPSGAGSVPPITPPPASGATPPASPPGASLEERLGTRWAVWVGGVALALGGLLLVRYSIEQGWFGPGARIVMGLLFASGLIAAGEWFRRSEQGLGLTAIPSAHIPGVLTAAGTATAFGTIYAAHALYDFIGPAMAFVLLGAVGIVTMLASALHGPALAGLGLAGAYVAPILVSSVRPSPWPVVIYLAVVAAAAMGLARVRRWLWLAALAVGGAFIWGLLYAAKITTGITGGLDWTLAGYAHALIQLLLAAGFIAVLPNFATSDHDARPDPVAAGALGALALLTVLLLDAGRFDLAGALPFLLAAAAILMAAAWLSAPAAPAAIFAGAVVLAGAVLWPGLKAPLEPTLLPHELAGMLRVPENVTSYLWFASFTSLGLLAAATLRLLRGPALSAPLAGLYALAATLTPLAALVLAYLRVTQFDRSISFAFAGAALALIFAVAAERFKRAEIDELAGTRLATGAFAAAAIAAFAFGLTAFLDRGYLTVAFGLAAYGTAWIAARRDIPLLRHVVTALALIVLARIAWNPRIMGDDVGSLPILNWLLAGYGIPAVAFWGAARLIERRTDGISAQIADAVAILLAALLCFFEIHHALNAGDALAPRSGHVEQGLFALVALGFSYALMRLDLGRANVVFHYGSLAFGVLSALLIALGLGILENPLFSREPIAGPAVFSSLLLAYLVPGLAAAFVARSSRPHRPAWYVTGLAVLAALLVFGYVTLEVRHVFQGELIALFRRTGAPEQWTYSAAWLLLGLVFLGYGILRASIEARLASAALVLLSVGKVFVFDLAGLTGLWRALSFIVLGLVLIGIGLAYQTLLFKRPAAGRG